MIHPRAISFPVHLSASLTSIIDKISDPKIFYDVVIEQPPHVLELKSIQRSRTEQHQSYYSKDSKIEFPTLHIIGDTDQVIKREMSDDLVGNYFEENVTVIARHPDGHILPTKGDCKATIVDFINKRHAEANA